MGVCAVAPMGIRERNMNTNDLYTVVGYIAALSVATERFVDIIKGLIAPCCPYLTTKDPDKEKEARRQAWIQVLAFGCGIVTSGLAWPVTQKILPLENWPSWIVIAALGLLASGGSGFWNSIQSYLQQVKNLKGLAVETEKKKVTQRADGAGS